MELGLLCLRLDQRGEAHCDCPHYGESCTPDLLDPNTSYCAQFPLAVSGPQIPFQVGGYHQLDGRSTRVFNPGTARFELCNQPDYSVAVPFVSSFQSGFKISIRDGIFAQRG